MTSDQRERYSRHVILPDFGTEGQERLLASHVLIVGAGGLGSPVAMYLTAAGVGRITIADGDVVSLTNLQRQVIHTTPDIGRNKAESAAETMRALNPEADITALPHFLDDAAADALVQTVDLVVEATDNFASRYRISDCCARHGVPCIIGGVSHYGGQLLTTLPGTATYRDLFPDEPAGNGTDGPLPILGPVVGMLGTMMATEAVKVLSGTGQPLTDRLLTFDARTMQFGVFEF